MLVKRLFSEPVAADLDGCAATVREQMDGIERPVGRGLLDQVGECVDAGLVADPDQRAVHRVVRGGQTHDLIGEDRRLGEPAVDDDQFATTALGLLPRRLVRARRHRLAERRDDGVGVDLTLFGIGGGFGHRRRREHDAGLQRGDRQRRPGLLGMPEHVPQLAQPVAERERADQPRRKRRLGRRNR